MYGNFAGFDPSIPQHNGIGVELSTFKLQKNSTEQTRKKFPFTKIHFNLLIFTWGLLYFTWGEKERPRQPWRWAEELWTERMMWQFVDHHIQAQNHFFLYTKKGTHF